MRKLNWRLSLENIFLLNSNYVVFEILISGSLTFLVTVVHEDTSTSRHHWDSIQVPEMNPKITCLTTNHISIFRLTRNRTKPLSRFGSLRQPNKYKSLVKTHMSIFRMTLGRNNSRQAAVELQVPKSNQKRRSLWRTLTFQIPELP